MKVYQNWTDLTIQRQILPSHHSGVKLEQWKSVAGERQFESFTETWDIPQSLLSIQQLEHNLLPILASMEQTGITLDIQRLMELGKQIALEGDEHRTFIESVVGSGYNLASPKQLQELLFGVLQLPPGKKTKTGYSVDSEVLEGLKDKHPIVSHLLALRSCEKLHSTYILGLEKAVKADGKIHTTYESTITSTGRMSSLHPNLQNIPTGNGYGMQIKSCFRSSSKDHLLIVADYSQIELRVLAHLSNDEQLIRLFREGGDIHTQTARFLFPHEHEITADHRRKAKSVNFGVIYGISAFGLSRAIGLSPAEAKKYIDLFYASYTGVAQYFEILKIQALQAYTVHTALGRERFIENLASRNIPLRMAALREAMNMPIQGTAADILKLAIVQLCPLLEPYHAKILLQVHDELVIEAPKEYGEIVQQIVQQTMEQIWPECQVPLPVSIGCGERWTDAK